jgi:hypothetical protein
MLCLKFRSLMCLFLYRTRIARYFIGRYRRRRKRDHHLEWLLCRIASQRDQLDELWMLPLTRRWKAGKSILRWLLTLIASKRPDRFISSNTKIAVYWFARVRVKTRTYCFPIIFSILYFIFLLTHHWSLLLILLLIWTSAFDTVSFLFYIVMKRDSPIEC